MKKSNDEIDRGADFSKCKNYRYTLTRFWNKKLPHVLFILLNPSTADESYDDPTNRRGMGFAKKWGYGGVVFCNLFAYRTPFPEELKKAKNPVGPENNKWLKKEAKNAKLIISSWGNHGTFLNRNKEVIKMISKMHHLGLTKLGEPKHILYLKKSLKPIPFNYS